MLTNYYVFEVASSEALANQDDWKLNIFSSVFYNIHFTVFRIGDSSYIR